MVEAAPKSTYPLFDEELFTTHPAYAKDILTQFWKEQAKITRYRAEEFGVPRHKLGSIAFDMWEMLREDSERLSGNFVGSQPTTVYMDGLLKSQCAHVTEDIDENFKYAASTLVFKFIHQEKRHFIFASCRVEDILEVCQANGGIPRLTQEEVSFLQNRE